MKSDNCKNRNDIADQPTDIQWHVYPDDTSVQILPKLIHLGDQAHTQEFPDTIIFLSMFNDITNRESQKVQTKCLTQAREVATHASRFRTGCWCSCGLGSETTWKHNED